MAYSETLEVVKGDTRPIVITTIRDRNAAANGRNLDDNDETSWAPIVISGATIHMFIREIGETEIVDTLLGTVTDGPNGVVAFEFNPTTWSDPGQFEAEIQITFSDGGIQTLQDFIRFKVRDSVD